MGEEAETPLDYDRPMGTALDLAKRTQALDRRYPLAADTLLAVALAAAALVSLAATYDELPPTDSPFSHGWTVAVVVSMLALTLPLAWRRRFPFSVAVVVVGAFLIARIVVHVPEANVSLLVGWLLIYSVAVHGQRRFRTAVLIVCYIAIVAELVREYFFASFSSELYGPLLARFFSLFYNMLVLALPWLLGVAIWSLRDRQRKLADQTIELQAEREENASQAVFAERVRIAGTSRCGGSPRERDRRTGGRSAAGDGSPTGSGGRGTEFDRRLQPAGRHRASSPPRVPSPRR